MGGNFAPRQQPSEPLGAGYRARRLSELFGSNPQIARLLAQFQGQFRGPNVGAQVFSGAGGLPIFDIQDPNALPGALQDFSTVPTLGPSVKIDPMLAQVLAQLQSAILQERETPAGIPDAGGGPEGGIGVSIGQEAQTIPEVTPDLVA